MSRNGAPAARRKNRGGAQHLFLISFAVLTDGTEIECGKFDHEHTDGGINDLFWDTRANGVTRYDDDGITFYPASHVRMTRWNHSQEDPS